MATRADVARLAGVSPSTVTYVLNGQRPISNEVRERVLAAMAELRYRPNAMAAGLAGGRSNTIALLLPTTERDLKESDLEYVVGASRTAREFGYRLVLSTADRSDVDELLHLTRSGLVDGVLVMEVFLDDERVPLLRSCEVPFALIGRTADLDGIDFADRDFAEAGRLAVEYLHGLGHRRLAFIDAPPRPSGGYGVSVRAVEGVSSACKAAGVELEVLTCDLSVAAGHDLLIDLARTHPEITAIIAFNDEAVMGVYLGAREIGLRIPEDLSVMSTSLSEQRAAFFLPPITTISPPAARIAESATRALIRRLGRGETHELAANPGGLFTGDLVERASTGPPAR